uniref:Roundabout guidance receptor 4 n=1 Tax=Latimeria chalumnae TaxID=7897 RepID=H3AZJ1_LATCH
HDSGKYTCIAENQVGTVSATTTLSVQDVADAGQREKPKEIHRDLSSIRVDLDNVTALVSSPSVYLHWKVLSPSQHIDGYSIYYRSLLPASTDWTEKKFAKPTQHNAIISMLKRGYKYEFKVQPYAGKFYGHGSNVKHLRIPEEVPSAPPQSVTMVIAESQNGTVVISWEPPPHAAHNGIIKGYQVWCMSNKTQHRSDWMVNGGTHSLEIPALISGIEYWVQVAAINGAGVGVQSNPKYIFIEISESCRVHMIYRRKRFSFFSFFFNHFSTGHDILITYVNLPSSLLLSPTSEPITDITTLQHSMALEQVLEVVRQPAFIASIGVVIWVVLMILTICVYQQRTKRYFIFLGLYGFASEDIVIKHRMSLTELPWNSSTWKNTTPSTNFSGSSQFLWAESKENPSFRKSTLSFEKTTHCSRDHSVPIVPDSSIFGTLYVDLSELHPVNSLPISPSSQASEQRGSMPSPRRAASQATLSAAGICACELRQSCSEGNKRKEKQLHSPQTKPYLIGTSKMTYWSWNLYGGSKKKKNLTQNPWPMVTSPEISPPEVHSQAIVPVPHRWNEKDSVKPLTPSTLKRKGSSKSTKLTTDVEPLQSDRSAPKTPSPPLEDKASYLTLSYSRLSTASFSLSTNEEGEELTPEEVARYLELSEEEEETQRQLISSVSSIPRPFSPPHTYGYICGPLPSDLDTDLAEEEDDLEIEAAYQSSRRVFRRYCHTPTSSIRSLVNGWGSVSEDNFTSARCSMISSSDGSFLMDANFAQALAVAVDSFCFGLAQSEED